MTFSRSNDPLQSEGIGGDATTRKARVNEVLRAFDVEEAFEPFSVDGIWRLAELDHSAPAYAKARWDSLSKPLDGLGDFETLVCRLAAIEGRREPSASRRCVVVMCADNGVVSEGVSQCGCEVTSAVTSALGKGISSLNTLARTAQADVLAVDVGVDAAGGFDGVLDRRVRRGTRNIALEDATTLEETLRAVNVGVAIARRAKRLGYDLVLSGEMGIGNTTTSTALLCALTGLPVEEVVGRGAGLDDDGLARKTRVIRKALQRRDWSAYRSSRDRALAALMAVGGLDIAALVGLALGCAAAGLPLILDGAISSTSALVAESLVPGVREFLVPSHRGRERSNREALRRLRLKPFLDGSMALGEGTGATMLLPLLDMALAFYRNASTFDDAGVDQYERFEGC